MFDKTGWSNYNKEGLRYHILAIKYRISLTKYLDLVVQHTILDD